MLRTWSATFLVGSLSFLLMTMATPGVDAQQAKAIPFSIIEATPAFHSLPVTALMRTGAEYNLKVESFQVQGGGEAGQIFASGHADVMTSGIDKAIGFMAKKLVDVKVVGVIQHSINWSLVASAKTNIKTLADLKGKNVGLSGPGSFSDMILRWQFTKAGLNPDKDLSLIALGSVANLYAGLENGRVDAAVLVRPFLTKAIESGMGRVIGDWEAMFFPNLVSIVRTKDLRENRDKFIQYQSAMKSVLNRMKTDRAFALNQARLSYPNSSVEELTKELDFAAKVYWAGNGDMTRALYDQSVEPMIMSGRIGKTDMPSFESFVETLPAK
jgi:ABC-type nitrate/sulfonate/bicarbonate transport system substrate-binding protein